MGFNSVGSMVYGVWNAYCTVYITEGGRCVGYMYGIQGVGYTQQSVEYDCICIASIAGVGYIGASTHLLISSIVCVLSVVCTGYTSYALPGSVFVIRLVPSASQKAAKLLVYNPRKRKRDVE